MISKLKELKNRQGFMKYFKNTSWLFAEKILRMIVGLFVGIWVARYLGPEQYGLFSYAQSFVGLFLVFSSLGLSSIVIRELVKNEDKQNIYLGTSFWLKFIGAIFTILLLIFILQFVENNEHTKTFILIIASGTIFQSLNVIDFYFQSKVMSKYIVFANFISLFFTSILKIVLILMDAPLLDFVLIILFDSFILSIGYVFFYLKVVRTNFTAEMFFKYFDFQLAKKLLRDSWPLMFSAFIITIYQQLDQVMIKNMVNNYEVGQYAVAARVNSIFSFLPGILLSTFTPAIINALKQSETLFLARLQKLYNFIILYSYIVIIIVFLLAGIFIIYTFGIRYTDSVKILHIIIFSNIFAYIGAVSSRWYVNVGYEKKILYRNVLGVFFNIVGNYLLIPLYGAIGAAVTTLLSQISANLLFDFLDKESHIVFNQKIKALFLVDYIKLILKGKKEI